MKIRLASDIHLEFFKHNKLKSNLFNKIIPVMDSDKETVLVLAGDIHVGVKALGFVTEMCERFKAVIYVPGNHEYYRHNINEVDDELSKWDIPNFHFLNPGTASIDGVKFVGATVWTDMRNGDPMVTSEAQFSMNDFRQIYFYDDHERYKNFVPSHWLNLNRMHMDFFKNNISENCVVVSHHAPSMRSVAQKFKNRDTLLNHAYASNLDKFIFKSKPKLWLHGHVHNNNDYHIGDSRIVSNPYGYHNYEINDDYDPSLVLEI